MDELVRLFRESPKITCSMVGIVLLVLGISISKIFCLAKVLRNPGGEFDSALLGKMTQQEPGQVMAWLSQQKILLARVLEAVVPLLGTNVQVVQRAADQITQREIHRAERGLPHLPVLGCLAFMLGVLGTLDSLINTGGGACSNVHCASKEVQLAIGISEALGLTLLGLGAAVTNFLVCSLLQTQFRQRVLAVIERRDRLIQILLRCRHGTRQEDSLVAAWKPATQLGAGAARMVKGYEATKGPAVLFTAPLVSLLTPLAIFLYMASTFTPDVNLMPVAYASAPRFETTIPAYPRPGLTLLISEDQVELREAGAVLMSVERDQPIQSTQELEDTLALIRKDDTVSDELLLRSNDDVILQDLITLLDVCRSAGFVNLTLAETECNSPGCTDFGRDRWTRQD